MYHAFFAVVGIFFRLFSGFHLLLAYLCGHDMRILHLNTSESAGGAAIAARRLVAALNRHGVEARMMVAASPVADATTLVAGSAMRRRWAFLAERLTVFAANGFSREGLWQVDVANAGVDVTATEAFRRADVIHLHWVNQGYLSLSVLARIIGSGKRVVWTMHDMWPFTGVCHYARTCQLFRTHCHDCPSLRRPAPRDLACRVFDRKAEAYARGHVTFVGCSQWLAGEARSSRLAEGHDVVSIPNTYPAGHFHPGSRREARRRLGLPDTAAPMLLFACQKVTDPRKGMHLLVEALRSLPAVAQDLHVMVAGDLAESVADAIPFPVHPLGYVRGDAAMSDVYRAADAFVTPSLEDNLPNTIMEAMACGTPCVGFRVGGIPEMIIHGRNGYVAGCGDVPDLARGIGYVLDADNRERLSAEAAASAVERWSEERVATQYINVYSNGIG